MIENIKPQDTYDHIFGASFDMWSWWGVVRSEWDQRGGAPDFWNVIVPIDDPYKDGPALEMVVTHNILLGAMRRIVDGRVSKYVSQYTYQECVSFLKDGPEHADFDADSADQVMQVATLGEVVYG
ncbi:hypothetical protein [Streptomyces scabiei]|uniref:hypothetical protein n=1 Tax=Streptomyces scabiei TaxID=1930 RepID=UPI00299FDD9F|nr:hypothetical protein [Streptomyces scabiei]MDX3206084.1 hypothetical protein [Streptomyces scabiei]